MRMAAENRYDREKYRNFEDKWKKYSGISSATSKVILDFGCGAGIEALEFARENKVIIADINPLNLEVANRLLILHGF